MILIVCALPAELRYFTARAGVDVVACGIGPVEAAMCAATRLVGSRYEAVINAGIAGAFRGHAHVGEALLIERETLADFGLEGGTPLMLPAGAKLIDTVRASDDLLARAEPAALRRESGITVTRVTATARTGERLYATYGAGVESMEGFAVLRAGTAARVPALEIRGISNYVGDRSASEWDFAAGAQATARALDAVLDALNDGTAKG